MVLMLYRFGPACKPVFTTVHSRPDLTAALLDHRPTLPVVGLTIHSLHKLKTKMKLNQKVETNKRKLKQCKIVKKIKLKIILKSKNEIKTANEKYYKTRIAVV